MGETEHTGATIAIERLQDDVAMFGTELGKPYRIARNKGRRHEIGVLEDIELLRRVANLCRVIDDERFRVHRLEQMGVGDVVHVERRVLPHQDNIAGREVFDPLLRSFEMPADLVAHFHFAAGCRQTAIAQRQCIGVVNEKAVAAVLGLQHQREGGISANVDTFDGIHLDRDLESHGQVTPVVY